MQLHLNTFGISPTLLARFGSKVNKNGPIPPHCPELGPCWLWIGARDRDGYGVTHDDDHKYLYAHRTSWLVSFGPIPKGLFVLHHCDNPPCVRPTHLFLGTVQDNARDMVSKGRSTAGIKNPQAVLTVDQVVSIRTLHATQHISSRRLAILFAISPSQIKRILRGESWRIIT